MERNICNVIWVDDDIDDICPEFGLGGLKRDLKECHIEVIGKAHSFIEFEELMKICKDRVDAVITDANFNDTSRAVARDDDFKGLIKMISIIDSYNKSRDIPFFLYSGKGEYFKFYNGELDYFDINKRRFSKGDYKKMFKRIKEDVEHINSPSYRIRNKYAKELGAASLIDGNEECLMNALLYDYSDEWKETEDYFNPIRKVAESIFDECKKLNILPPINELNTISRFLYSGTIENYIIIDGKEIMPKPLSRSLWYFLEITQDGSHKKGDLKLGVDKYVRESKNVNLFRTVLYIAMDLCLWFKDVLEEAKEKEFVPKWRTQSITPPKHFVVNDDAKIYIPQEDKELGVWYCGDCVIGIRSWESGKGVKLKEKEPNANSKTNHKYPFYAKYEKVDL